MRCDGNGDNKAFKSVFFLLEMDRISWDITCALKFACISFFSFSVICNLFPICISTHRNQPTRPIADKHVCTSTMVEPHPGTHQNGCITAGCAERAASYLRRTGKMLNSPPPPPPPPPSSPQYTEAKKKIIEECLFDVRGIRTCAGCPTST